MQSGYLYHYAFAMIIGLSALLAVVPAAVTKSDNAMQLDWPILSVLIWLPIAAAWSCSLLGDRGAALGRWIGAAHDGCDLRHLDAAVA